MSVDCSCEKCVYACKSIPGWMSPHDADAAISAGLSDRLMRVAFKPARFRDVGIYTLAPAIAGHEGRDAPGVCAPNAWSAIFGAFSGIPWIEGRCTFLNEQDRCAIHDSGFKPIQCRTSYACTKAESPDNFAVAAMWNTDYGAAVLKRWNDGLHI